MRRELAQIRRSIGPDLAAFLFFSVVCIAQAAGRVVPDTKIDVVLAPADFVAKTLSLWEPWTGLGHVPNQSWGYLFPIAPFHVVLDTLQVPAWMAQRVLFALIMTLAFAGLRRLCAEMEIGTTGGRLVAGAAYACSAAMLAQIGVAAAAQPLAHAVVPWVLLQLVKGARTGRARRHGLAAAAWTVVAGGVNVTVVLAVLAIPALYLLTRVGGATRRRLSAWWAIGTVTATLWWTLPLVIVRPLWFDLTGVTETASITTSTASVLESLRGTANWLNYWRLGGSVTEAGWTQVSSALVIGAMVGLVAAGLVGLSNSSMRDRRFLVLCLLAGVAVQSAAYGGPVGGPLAEPLQRLLDGPLVPFRNVSKFAPLVALPLALGVAHALRGLPDVLGWVRAAHSPSGRRLALPPAQSVLVVGLLVLATVPVFAGNLLARGSFERIPEHWSDLAEWLADREPTDRALLLPAAAFGEYDWGRPLDEPLQVLATSAWDVRNLYPAGGSFAGYRLLDTIEAVVTRGRGDPGLAALVARAGFRYLVVRNDLDWRARNGLSPVTVSSVLDRSPGFRVVARFGPDVLPGYSTDFVRPGFGPEAPTTVAALVVYEIDPSTSGLPMVSSVNDSRQLTGGPESLGSLARSDALPSGALLTMNEGSSSASSQPPGAPLLSDAPQRRDVVFPVVRPLVSASYVLGPDDPAPNTGAAVRDWREDPDEPVTVAQVDGARLSSSSYAQTTLEREAAAGPFSAFDRDVDTAWVPAVGEGGGIGQWLSAELAQPRTVREATISLLVDSPSRPVISRVATITDAGTAFTTLRRTSAAQRLEVVDGPTRSVKVFIQDVSGTGLFQFQVGIAELTIGGLTVHRPWRVPASPAAPVIVVERSTADPFDPSRWDEESSLDRVVATGSPADYDLRATVSLRTRLSETAVARLMPPSTMSVTSSSHWAGRPAFVGVRAFDRDPSTAWVADAEQAKPTLFVSWSGRRRITSVSIDAAAANTATPTRLRIVALDANGEDGDSREVGLVDGVATFPGLLAGRLRVEVLGWSAPRFVSGLSRAPVAVAEMRFEGVDDGQVVRGDEVIELPCGGGPDIEVDGALVQTAVRARLSDLLDLVPVPATPCVDNVSIPAGEHRITLAPSGLFASMGLRLTPRDDTARSSSPEAPRSGEVVSWGRTDRTVRVGPGEASLLTLPENASDGWTARLDDRELTSVVVDGWRQAWLVPAGDGGDVHIEYGPRRLFLLFLGIGALGVLSVVALAMWPQRRSGSPCNEERVPGPAMHLAAAAFAVVVAGLAGLALWAVVLIVRRRSSLAAIALLAVVASGFLGVLYPGSQPWMEQGVFSAQAQILAILALVAVAEAGTGTAARETYGGGAQQPR